MILVELVTYRRRNSPGCSGFSNSSFQFHFRTMSARLFYWVVLTVLMNCRSFIEISNGVLSKAQAEDGITAMMQAAGFNSKEKISWRDFHSLLKDHEKELQFAQLNVKGFGKFGLQDLYLSFPLLCPHLIHFCVCAGMEKQGSKRLSRDQRVSFILPANR